MRMLKDDSAAVVWANDRGTGKARFVSFTSISTAAVEVMVQDAGRRSGERPASGAMQKVPVGSFRGMRRRAASAGDRPGTSGR